MNKTEYQFSIKYWFSEEEKKDLHQKHWPKLVSLCKRYLKNIEIEKGFPLRPEFPEALRGSWLLDKNEDKPPYSDVVSGAGYAFGIILEETLGMKWCVINDNYGDSISLAYKDSTGEKEYQIVSVPPFNYAAKREETQNVEVFVDGYRKFEEMINR